MHPPFSPLTTDKSLSYQSKCNDVLPSHPIDIYFIPDPPYPLLTFLTYGDVKRPLTHVKEGIQMHIDCSAPPTGTDDNVALTLFNGTNVVRCYMPANTKGEVTLLYMSLA